MRIALIVEGETERAFLPYLRTFLQTKLAGSMPRLDPELYDGRIPTENKLKRIVENLLADRQNPADCVIALTDVYTGTEPSLFASAMDAKTKMTQWVGHNPKFHPHVALHDFEAWLLPYWTTIQELAGHNKTAPRGSPEIVNNHHPPSYRIAEVFRIGRKGKAYVKPRDASHILRENDLMVAIAQCPELKSFVNTILHVCGGSTIP
ncbi:MAG: DUF4276 family protein [Chloroflexi bacterium]|nr:DUF4276 family protein [Chloroflexota bacterium]